MKIILASQSPRRKELLKQIGLEFTVCPSHKEEVITSQNPADVVRELSLQKAEDIQNLLKERNEMAQQGKTDRDDILVIGADTIVVYRNEILGKPGDEKNAKQMLEMLSGHTHSVFTGVTLLYGEKKIIFAEETKVTMCSMSKEEIEWYVNTGECSDKAGAYGIQGYGARFISRIEGDYNNVVGLPVCRIYQEMKKAILL